MGSSASALQRVAGIISPSEAVTHGSPLVSPNVNLPGVNRWGLSSVPNTNEALARSLRTPEAYFGRVSYDAGPSMTRFSSYPANDLTPATILGAQQQSFAGYPLQWCEMVEQVLSRDSHLSGIAQQRIDDILKGSWRLIRAKNDDISAAVRNFADEALRGVDDLEDAMGWLLWSNAYSYTLDEVIWKRDWITFPGPQGETLGPIEVIIPAKLEPVHPKHVRFDLRTDEPYLWLGSDQVSLPTGKFVFLRGEGHHPITARRGYMLSCVWLSLFRSIGWAGWTTFVNRFGMPVPLIEYDGDVAQYSEYKQAFEDILNCLGTGKGAIYPSTGAKFDIKDPPAGGRSSDAHSALSDACDSAQSVRVLGATLTAKIGNVGSFSASETHAEVKYAREEADARRLWSAVRSQLLSPMIYLNAISIAKALKGAGYNASPDMVLRRVPKGFHRVPREIDSAARIAIIDTAVNKLGLRVSAESLYDRFDIDQPLSDSDVLSGEATPVNRGGALVGSVKASNEGAIAPPDPEEGDPSYE
jgi:phage gp29-like protein